MSAVADALDVWRPHLPKMLRRAKPGQRGRPPPREAEFVADIRLAIADLPRGWLRHTAPKIIITNGTPLGSQT